MDEYATAGGLRRSCHPEPNLNATVGGPILRGLIAQVENHLNRPVILSEMERRDATSEGPAFPCIKKRIPAKKTRNSRKKSRRND